MGSSIDLGFHVDLFGVHRIVCLCATTCLIRECPISTWHLRMSIATFVSLSVDEMGRLRSIMARPFMNYIKLLTLCDFTFLSNKKVVVLPKFSDACLLRHLACWKYSIWRGLIHRVNTLSLNIVVYVWGLICRWHPWSLIVTDTLVLLWVSHGWSIRNSSLLTHNSLCINASGSICVLSFILVVLHLRSINLNY